MLFVLEEVVLLIDGNFLGTTFPILQRIRSLMSYVG
jgi:hypothetical protein